MTDLLLRNNNNRWKEEELSTHLIERMDVTVLRNPGESEKDAGFCIVPPTGADASNQ